ncbi:MAG: methyltransferase [Pyrinomonadaceae bacterium]
MKIDSIALDHLSTQQKNQIFKQIQYHVSALPIETVELTTNLILKFSILPNVTRPMSSKGIAKWLWRNSQLFIGKRVLDIGTGCGIQGITCKLGGASEVVLTDVVEQAVECSLINARNILPTNENLTASKSDLFESINNDEPFDLIVFAQPYFPGSPIADYEFTRGMFDTVGLQHRFFQDAKKYLRENGRIVMMSWNFVGEENDPAMIAKDFGYDLIDKDSYFAWRGVQQGSFDVVVFAAS